jgi:hypothetical protein
MSVLDRAYVAVRELLARFRGLSVGEQGELVRSLRPTAEDYAEIFIPRAAEYAAIGYTVLWGNVPAWEYGDDQTETRVVCAQAAHLTTTSPLARLFPGGYQSAARFMRPSQVWCQFELAAPKKAGNVFDGLVFLEEKLVWCPRPWKVLPRERAACNFWVDA